MNCQSKWLNGKITNKTPLNAVIEKIIKERPSIGGIFLSDLKEYYIFRPKNSLSFEGMVNLTFDSPIKSPVTFDIYHKKNHNDGLSVFVAYIPSEKALAEQRLANGFTKSSTDYAIRAYRRMADCEQYCIKKDYDAMLVCSILTNKNKRMCLCSKQDIIQEISKHSTIDEYFNTLRAMHPDICGIQICETQQYFLLYPWRDINVLKVLYRRKGTFQNRKYGAIATENLVGKDLKNMRNTITESQLREAVRNAIKEAITPY